MTATKMKGDGFYDAHSEVQLSIIEKTSALIQDSVERVPLTAGVFGVIDYGCAEGKNSIVSVKLVLEAVRKRNPDQVFSIVHNDLPANDFNRLFANLTHGGFDCYGDESSLTGRAKRAFVFASGGSFYRQVVPDASAHFGYSSSSIHWLSEMPPEAVRRHIAHWGGTAEEFESFRRVAARDWLEFWEARAREFVPGGRLVLTMGARLDPDCGDTASDTGEWLTAQIMFTLINDLLLEFVAEEAIANEQYEKFAYPIYKRNRKELLAPFDDVNSPVGEALSVEHLEVVPMPCPFYELYRRDGDKEKYAQDLTAAYRAFSEPLLLSGLFDVSEPCMDERRKLSALKILEKFWDRMRERIAGDPDRYTFNPITAVMVVARR